MSIEQILAQLREHKAQIDRLIGETRSDAPAWPRLCAAWDAVDEAISKLEGCV